MSVISVLAMVVLAGLVAFELGQVESRFNEFRTSAVEAEKLTLMINRDMNYGSRLTRSIMLGDDFDKNFTKLETRIADIYSHFQKLEALADRVSDNQSALKSAIAASLNDTRSFLEDGRARMQRLKPDHQSADARAAAWKAYKQEASPIAKSARKSFRALQQLLGDYIDSSSKAMENALSDARNVSFVIVLIVAVVIGVISLLATRSTLSQLEQMRRTMSDIGAHSNLAERIPLQGRDELSNTATIFNDMLGQFQQMIQQVANSTEQVTSSSNRLDSVARSGMEDQQSQNNEIATVVSAMNQMSNSVTEVSSDAQQAADSAGEARSYSGEGIALANDAVRTMQQLAQQTESTSAVVERLNEASGRIDAVLGVIQAVSEQTNLLALNAAIEAARAGDQGRGFAVVADEVRTLAIRSQESTQEIQSIVEELRQCSDDAVGAMAENQRLANDSVGTAQSMQGSLEQVVQAIEKIQEMNTHIAASANEQSTVAGDIHGTMNRLQSLSDSSQQSATEVEKSSHELALLANQLQGLITRFKY